MAPVQPIQPGPDYDKLADLIVAKMQLDPRFRGPKGDDGIDGINGIGTVGPVGPKGQDATAETVGPVIDSKIADAIGKLPIVEPCKCKPVPTPTADQHIVIVADKAASYWPNLSGQVKSAQDVYKGIEVVSPPQNFSGPTPQIVLYENSVPRVLGVGAYKVSAVLSRIVLGESL